MTSNDNLYHSLFPDDDEFDVGMSTIGLMNDHLNIENISKYYDIAQYNKTFTGSEKNVLSIMHLNIRSLGKNGDEMKSLLATFTLQPDVIAISESFLDSNSVDSTNLPGYQGFHSIRGVDKRGGVSIFTKDNISSDAIEEFSFINDEIEICTVSICIGDCKYVISCIYRPRFKHDNIKQFCKHFKSILQHRTFKNSNSILLGDFNINLLEHATHAETGNYLNMMQSLSFIPLISRPTRFPEGNQNARPSLLDHIYTNFIHQSIAGIIHYNITDHLPVFLNMVLPEKPNSTEKIRFRLFTRENKDLFKRELITVTWEEILIDESDINTNFNRFICLFNRIYNKHFPVITKIISNKRMMNPWITTGLLNSIRHKNKLFKKMKLGLIPQLEYNIYRNRTNALIKLTKRNYYLKLFSSYKNSTKKLWQAINTLSKGSLSKAQISSLIHEDRIISEPKDISETFNDHFVNIAPSLEKKLAKAIQNPLDFLRGNFDNPMEAPEATIDDFSYVVRSMQNKKCQITDFSIEVLKDNIASLAHPIINLFNQSIREGSFPEYLKKARIVPIYKRGPKSDVNNYRPISLLNIFSKIFEKIMKKFLTEYIESNNILSPNQFGFQRGKSTLDALILFTKNLYSQLDQSHHVLSIFVDFCKAFDTVPHDILLKKLEFYGIRGTLNKWFKDYLSNRTQQTMVNSCLSDSKQITFGVPQGSVLGPLLFLLFINDLPHFSTVFSTILFADDANLSLSGKDPKLLVQTANNELGKFYYWCLSNRLSINTIKTFFILFSNRPPNELPPLIIKSNYTYEVIKRAYELKFLGVFFDQNLTFKRHINYITNRLASLSSLFYRVKDIMPEHVLKIMYHAHVNSIVNYCNVIWANTFPTHLTPLVRIQKRIIRNIARADFFAHTEPLFKQLGLLNLEGIRKLSLALHFFKYRADYQLPLLPNHTYPTRHRNQLRPPLHSSRLFEHSFLYNTPRYWNEIQTLFPDISLDEISKSAFKHRIKSSLLQ